jgi:predicted ATPase
MTKLNIKNFKCFHEIDIPINQLTVFAGANGNGKSTAIQALLFLRRTIEHCAKWEKTQYNLNNLNNLNVELNGVYCLNLGNSAYVLPVDSDETDITIGLSKDSEAFKVKYSTNTGKELWLTPIEPLVNTLKNNPLYYQEFYYLNAERIGPRLSQNIKFYDYANVGFKGEYTAQVISDLNYSFKIDGKKVNNEYIKGNRFEHHVNAWLEYIIDGASIIPHYDDKTHTARFEVQNSYSKGYPIVPTNTGFGISYALPIIVSGLIALKDRFLIVENPEAHLHPAAQSKMGYFLGIIANSGVRVIIETHSDHIINGIQIAVAKQKIKNVDVSINFFNKEVKSATEELEEKASEVKIQPIVLPISITAKGELTSWPSGFFDQSQIDFSELFKIRRG